MAWVTPSTKVLGDLITAAIWNQDIVANATALYGSINYLSQCVSVKTTNQTISDVGGGTIIRWTDSDTVDTDAYHDPGGANPTKFYVPVTGSYLCACRLAMSGNTIINYEVNGAVVVPAAISASATNAFLLSVLNITADAYLEVRGTGSGAARTLNDGTFTIVLLSGGGLTGAL